MRGCARPKLINLKPRGITSVPVLPTCTGSEADGLPTLAASPRHRLARSLNGMYSTHEVTTECRWPRGPETSLYALLLSSKPGPQFPRGRKLRGAGMSGSSACSAPRTSNLFLGAVLKDGRHQRHAAGGTAVRRERCGVVRTFLRGLSEARGQRLNRQELRASGDANPKNTMVPCRWPILEPRTAPQGMQDMVRPGVPALAGRQDVMFPSNAAVWRAPCRLSPLC